MNRILILAFLLINSRAAKSQTSFSNPAEAVAVPVIKLSSGTGGIYGSGGSIDFYKGIETSPMGRIYTSNIFSAGLGNSIGRLTLSSYYNSFRDELTLYNGNVGIGTSSPSKQLDVIGTGSFSDDLFVRNIKGTQSGGNLDLLPGTTGHYIRFSRGDYNGVVGFIAGDAPAGTFMVSSAGYFGIGTTIPSEKLSVNGNIRAQKIIVSQTGWADYVFHPTYQLRPLSSLEDYIKQYKHLPDVPSTEEIEATGNDLGATQALLLKKIEELTLYVIKQDKQLQIQAEEIKQLKEKLN